MCSSSSVMQDKSICLDAFSFVSSFFFLWLHCFMIFLVHWVSYMWLRWVGALVLWPEQDSPTAKSRAQPFLLITNCDHCPVRYGNRQFPSCVHGKVHHTLGCDEHERACTCWSVSFRRRNTKQAPWNHIPLLPTTSSCKRLSSMPKNESRIVNVRDRQRKTKSRKKQKKKNLQKT